MRLEVALGLDQEVLDQEVADAFSAEGLADQAHRAMGELFE
jgi:hypothetical protein